jgi:hypothetical protein
MDENIMGSAYPSIDNLEKIDVEVTNNFGFVTAFGTTKISALMAQYVFEFIFPAIKSFLLIN